MIDNVEGVAAHRMNHVDGGEATQDDPLVGKGLIVLARVLKEFELQEAFGRFKSNAYRSGAKVGFSVTGQVDFKLVRSGARFGARKRRCEALEEPTELG